jgi:hypothetical protein
VRELRLSQSAFNHKAKQETKKKLMIGSLMMCLSVVVLLVKMLVGIAMRIQQNFTLAPAHVHLTRSAAYSALRRRRPLGHDNRVGL